MAGLLLAPSGLLRSVFLLDNNHPTLISSSIFKRMGGNWRLHDRITCLSVTIDEFPV